MIVGGSFIKSIRFWRSYTAEDDFYHRLVENPAYPFEDLGNGFYYIRLQSDKVILGAALIACAIIFIIMFTVILGSYSIPTSIFLLGMLGGSWSIYGNLSTRELIISRLGGYLLRIQTNGHVLCEQEIFNIYIRLQKKIDSVQASHFYLILGGYLLDDIRISRLSVNELPMRLMGRRLARNLGINYFDYVDETAKHSVFQYRGYSTLKWRKSDVGVLFEQTIDSEDPEKVQLSPHKVQGTLSNIRSSAKVEETHKKDAAPSGSGKEKK